MTKAELLIDSMSQDLKSSLSTLLSNTRNRLMSLHDSSMLNFASSTTPIKAKLSNFHRHQTRCQETEMRMSHKNKNSNFRVAYYIRVSTEEQAENPEGSIRNQEDRLRQALEYKNRQGNFGELVGVYVDAGISAKNMKRPKLQEMLKAIRNKEIDLVMVTELSRLSRNTRDFIQMWDMMRDLGCRFTSLREDFDTTNAAGELVLFQLMNLAQFERRQTSERVEANLQARAARGLYNGGPVPVGYKLNPDRPGYLQVDQEMAEIVKRAFDTFIEKGTLAKTAIALNDKGLRLRKQMEGASCRQRSGVFTVDNLQAILRNKAYIGVRVYKIKGEVKEARAVWPAVISDATFKRVGEILDKNRSHLKPLGKKRTLPYILSGITYCETCKSAMSGKSATGNGGKVGYYEHVWATKRDSGLTKKIFKCNPHRVPAKKLEPLVWNEFLRYVNDPMFVKTIFEKVQSVHAENPNQKEKDRLRAKVFGINSQIEALAERLAELPKTVSATPIYAQLEKLEAMKKQHEEAMNELSQGPSKAKLAKVEMFEAFAKHYREFIVKGMDADQKKQAIQKFIRKVEISPETVKVHFITDEEHFDEELHRKRRGSGLSGFRRPKAEDSDFFISEGSNTLTNGAR
jgi:site-specific DNA recombinase